MCSLVLPSSHSNRLINATSCFYVGMNRHSNRHTPRRKCKMRSKFWWLTGFRNSHDVSHFAAFFIVVGAKTSVAESVSFVFQIYCTHSISKPIKQFQIVWWVYNQIVFNLHILLTKNMELKDFFGRGKGYPRAPFSWRCFSLLLFFRKRVREDTEQVPWDTRGNNWYY